MWGQAWDSSTWWKYALGAFVFFFALSLLFRIGGWWFVGFFFIFPFIFRFGRHGWGGHRHGHHGHDEHDRHWHGHGDHGQWDDMKRKNDDASSGMAGKPKRGERGVWVGDDGELVERRAPRQTPGADEYI